MSLRFLIFGSSSPSTQMLGLSDYVADEVRKSPEEMEVAQGDTQVKRIFEPHAGARAPDIAIETREG